MIWSLILIPIFTLIAIIAIFKWSNSSVISKVSVGEKIIALTFDDGPNPEATEALLKILKDKNAKATFFVLGKYVEAFPEIVVKVVTEGHEIGNHSYSHPFMLDPRTKPMLAELDRTSKLIEAATGKSPTLFRPPYLMQGLGLKRAVSRLNMQSIGAISNWKLFKFQDWAHQDEPKKIAEVMLESAHPGAIMVLHDGHSGAETAVSQDYRGGTATAVSLIIDELQAQGYQFVTVSELLSQS